MTRDQREKLCEIMGYLWAKADERMDDALAAGYAEAIGELLADDCETCVHTNPEDSYREGFEK